MTHTLSTSNGYYKTTHVGNIWITEPIDEPDSQDDYQVQPVIQLPAPKAMKAGGQR